MKRSLSFNIPAVMYHMNGNIQSKIDQSVRKVQYYNKTYLFPYNK